MSHQERNPANALFGFNETEARTEASEPVRLHAQWSPVPGVSSAPASGPAQAPPLNDTAPPVTPQYVYVQGRPPSSASSRWAATKMPSVLFWLLLALLGGNLYLTVAERQRSKEVQERLSKQQSDQFNLLTRRLDSSDERYAQLSGQFQVTTERLGLTQKELTHARGFATHIQKQEQEAVQQLNQAIAQKAGADELNRVEADANAKIGSLSTDIAGTQKALDSTKAELTGALAGAKAELSGDIARTHEELVALAHRTDRDYFEFSLGRKGARQQVGTVTVELQKTNPKKNEFTVNLYFDDNRAERKDKAIDEPVYFYAQGASSPLELVVNKLSRSGVTGYISTPKGFFPNTPTVLSSRPGL